MLHILNIVNILLPADLNISFKHCAADSLAALHNVVEMRGQKIGNATLSVGLFYFLQQTDETDHTPLQLFCIFKAWSQLKCCLMSGTRNRKVGMKEIQQWLIRKSYESERYPLTSKSSQDKSNKFNKMHVYLSTQRIYSAISILTTPN